AADLGRSLARVRQQLARLLDLYLDEKLDKDGYDERATALKREEASLAERLSAAKATAEQGDAEVARRDAVLAYCALLRRGLDRLDDARRRDVLVALVDKVVVGERDLVIHCVLDAGGAGDDDEETET